MDRRQVLVAVSASALGGRGRAGGSAGSDAAPSLAPFPAPVGIALWGDSLTRDYASSLQRMMAPRPIFQGGVGGQTSTQIAARQGGVVSTMRVAGDRIPGSGAVSILRQTVLLQTANGPGPIAGSLAGVHGTVRRTTAGAYSFTRTEPGDPVGVSPAGAPFIVDTFGRRNWPTVFWYGRNNAEQRDRVLADLAASIAFLATGTPCLVLSVLNGAREPAGTGGYDAIRQLNEALAAAYPHNFLDIRAHLVGQYNRNSAQDVTDHAADVPPSSLRRDDLHMNDAGRRAIALRVRQHIDESGW